MANKANTVFAITELLERILLALHPRDLLLSQSVGRTLKDTINHSIRIQQRLIFTPGLHASQTPTESGTSVINSLLSRAVESSTGRKCKIVTYRPYEPIGDDVSEYDDNVDAR